MPIQQIFPQPIYISKLNRALTKQELRAINKHKKKTYKNEGNTTSNDSYVLENKIFKNLKKDLNDRILDYVDKVLCTNSPIIPYITQSWINYTETNQYHHRHSHSNAHISGVSRSNRRCVSFSIVFRTWSRYNKRNHDSH